MPELPEVETVRRGLEPVLRGRRFVHVEQRRKDLRFPLPERFAERLTGRKVERLDRRAKYILIHLDGGEVLAVHLGMTGRFESNCRRAGDGPPLPARRGRAGEGGIHDAEGIPPPLSPPHKGEGDFSSATTPTSTATTPSTTTSCSRCRAAPSSPTTTRAASAT